MFSDTLILKNFTGEHAPGPPPPEACTFGTYLFSPPPPPQLLQCLIWPWYTNGIDDPVLAIIGHEDEQAQNNDSRSRFGRSCTISISNITATDFFDILCTFSFQLRRSRHRTLLIYKYFMNDCTYLGQTNLISGSTDPTDPVFVESRKK